MDCQGAGINHPIREVFASTMLLAVTSPQSISDVTGQKLDTMTLQAQGNLANDMFLNSSN